MLQELERRMSADDPALGRRLAGDDPWARWRSAWRIGMSVPVVLLAVALSILAFVLQLSALGIPLLGWALLGALRWLVIRGTGTAQLLGPPHRT